MRSITMSFAAVLTTALAGRAVAQPAPAPPATADADAAAAEGKAARADDVVVDGDGGRKPKKEKASTDDDSAPHEHEIDVSGRVFLRATAYDDDVNPWIGGFSLDSARLQLDYRWKKRVSAEISAEIRGRGSIRDAYLDVELSRCLTLRAGRFKAPASTIERTSTWTLPTIDRPLGSTVLDGGLAVTGRRNGVGLVWRGGGRLHPRVEATAGQSLDLLTGEELPRPLEDGAGVMATVRGELRPYTGDDGGEVRIGAFAQNRLVTLPELLGHPSVARRYWAGGLDLEADLPGAGLRVWADVIAGSGPFGWVAAADEAVPFVVAQAVIGWRRGGGDRGKKFVEPFASASYVNPNARTKRDVVTEVKVGVAGGRWKRWRAQAQVALQNAEAERPAKLGGFDVDVDDRVSVTAQLGAAF
jgi:hypothetical protein